MSYKSKFSASAPYACVLVPFAAYTLTAAPLVSAGDAGELISAMFSLGIPHPPGYPLFALTGKAATLFPLGDISFRGNILSAFLVSLTVFLVYRSLRELSGRDMPLLFLGVSLAFAFSGPVWGIATEAEVYPGSLLFTAAAVYFVLRWRNGAGDRYAYAASFALGLAVCGHYGALIALPGLVFIMALHKGGSFRFGAVSLASGLMGLSTFLYVPVRAYAGPLVNWGDADGLTNFIAHITRASYGDLGAFRIGSHLGPTVSGYGVLGVGTLLLALGAGAAVSLILLRKRGVPVIAAGVAVLTLVLLAKLTITRIGAIRLGYTASLITSQGWWLVVAAAVLGLYAVYRRDRYYAYGLALVALSMTVVYVYRVPADPRDYMLPVAEKFFAPWFAFTSILGGAGFAWIYEAAGRIKPARFAAAAVPAVLAAVLLLVNYTRNDRFLLYWPYDYSVDMVRTFDQNSVFLSEGDHHPFFMVYQKVIEKARPDVTVLNSLGILFDGYEALDGLMKSGAVDAVFCSQEGELNPFPGIQIEQAGVLNRWVTRYGESKDPVKYYVFRGDMDMVKDSGYMNRSIYANYYYHMGRRLVNMRRDEEARKYLNEALRAGGIFPWVQMDVGNIERYWGMNDAALGRYKKAVELAPARFEAYLNMGAIYMDTGRLDKAEAVYLKALEFGPVQRDPEAYMQLARIYEARGMKEKAIGYWREYAEKPGADTRMAAEKIREMERKY